MKRLIACLVLTALTAAGVACSQTGAQDKRPASPGAESPSTLAPPASTASSTSGSAATPTLPTRPMLPALTPATSRPTAQVPALKSGTAPASKEITTPSGRTAIKVPHGLVTLIGDVKVPAAETGALMEIKVKEGDVVDLDTVLAVIDNRDTLAKRQMAEGELAVAEAQAESTAELEAAQKAWEVAKAELAQFDSIRSKNPGAVSEQEVRRARFQVERAMAQIKVAETDRQVAGLTTGVKRAQLNATDNELNRREIKAPLKGEVVEIYKKQGEWVQPGEAVMRIVSLDTLYVEGFVNADQANAGALEGKKANVTVHVFDPKSQQMIEHTVAGAINYASPLVEGSGRSRQFRVRAEIENTFADNRWIIQPGSMAEMTIETVTPAPIRATGSTSPRNSLTPVSTRATADTSDSADRNATKDTSGDKSDSASEPKFESLKPVAPRGEEVEPKSKPRSRPF